jgi:dipeptidyl-peptidase 4
MKLSDLSWGRGRALRGAGAGLLFFLAVPAFALAQIPRVAEADWDQANRFRAEALRPYIYTSSVTPQFINDTDEFWYRWQDGEGARWMRVNPRTRTKTPLFDHDEMARILTETRGRPVDRSNLNLTNIEFTEDSQSIRFSIGQTRYEFHLTRKTLEELPRETPPRQERVWRAFSPDSTAYVFAREHNLFFVEMSNEEVEIQLSDDGERWYSFGSRTVEQSNDDDDQQGERTVGQQGGNADRDPRVRPSVTWSPDSRRFYISRSDSRAVEDLFLVNSLTEPRPSLMTYKYAMPGEENVAQQELHVFDRETKKLERLPIEKWKDQRLFDIHWTTGSDVLRLVRRDRPQRRMELIEVALNNGNDVRVLVSESTENAHLQRQNVRYLDEGGDFLWFSRRTGWQHYYLYSHDGRLKNAVTTGAWNAESIVELDSIGKRVYVRGVGREAGENPYYAHLYRVNLDGSGFTLLDPGNANHASRLSPSRRFVVNNHSRVDMAPRSLLFDDRGNEIMVLEEQDISGLIEMGWQMPETFVVKAADGVTDIYGNLYKPFNFDPTKSYPIIAHVYPGPQTESVRYTFSASNQQQELAQLGFIVIQIGNRGGSPQRSAAYHSYGYFNLRDYGLADKKFGIEQLASRHSWVDVNRVGIYGHSGGGFMTAAALMVPPYNDFFKVGVSSAGNHDNNVYNQNWSEQHHGLREVRNGNGENGDVDEMAVTFEIDVPTNHEMAKNLKHRLLLVHGDMDNNVHPAGTIRLVKALIDEGKRFDFMLFPGMAHGFGGYTAYFQRMMFEYFAEHLIGDYYRNTAEGMMR